MTEVDRVAPEKALDAAWRLVQAVERAHVRSEEQSRGPDYRGVWAFRCTLDWDAWPCPVAIAAHAARRDLEDTTTEPERVVCPGCGSLTTRRCGMCSAPVCCECAFSQYEGGTYIGSLCEDCYQP